EQTLRETEERLALVMEGSQLGYWDWNMETGEVYRNARWAEMLGFTLEEIKFTVRQWTDLIHPDDRDAASKSIQDHLEGKTSAHRKEYRMSTKDGQYKWILDQARVVKRDPDGKPLRMSGTHTDITERKEAEQKVLASETLLRQVLESTQDPIFAIDREYRLLLNNQRHQQVLVATGGHPFHVGENVLPLDYGPEVLAQWRGLYDRVFNGEEIKTETEWPYADGMQHVIESNFSPLRDVAGNIMGALVVIHDITERKHVQERIQRSEALLKEMGKIAHVGGWELDAATMKQVWTDETYIIHDREREIYDPNSTEELSRFKPDSKGLIEKAFEEALVHGRPYDLEVEMVTVKGNRKWVRAVCAPFLVDGKVIKLTGAVQDITERKQAETILTRRLEDLALINDMNDAVNRGGDLVEITEMLAQSAKKIFGSQSASLYLLSPDKKRLLLQHYTMARERVVGLEKLIGRSVPQIDLPIGGDDHFSRVLQSDGGFLITGPKDIGAWLADFLNTSFLTANVRPLLRRIVPSAVKLLNINSVVSIPLKVGDDLMGVIEFIADGEFAEGALERLRSVRHQLSEVILRKRTEQDLIESNEKYRLLSEELEERVKQRTAEVRDLYDNAPAGYHSLDEAGCFLQINQTELNWLGYSRDEVIGRPFADFVTAKGLATFKENFTAFKQRGWVRDLEMEFMRKDGTSFYTLVNAAAIKDEAGNYLMSRSTVVDITDRKQAVQALRESEASLQNFLDTAHDLIQSLDEQGKFLYVNNAWCATLGYSLEEALHLTMFDVIVPEHHAACREMLKQLVVGKEPDRVEVVFKTKQGQAVIVEGHVNSRRGANGQLATNGIFRDITLRKQADEALKASETKYRQLFENMNEGFSLQEIITDKNGQPVDFRYLDANSVFEHHSGIAPQKVLGKTIQEVFPQVDLHLIQMYGKVALTGEPVSLEYFSTTINRYVSVRAFSPKYGQFATIFEDITERKQAEEKMREGNERLNMANAALEKAMRVKDEFLASMSHELRTPLTGILGLSESMQMNTYGELNERQKKITKSIYDSGQHLLDLINDILDLSKIEAGKLEIQRSPTLFADICRAGLQLTKGMAHQKQLQVDAVIPDEPIILNLDMRRIKQVVVNLLSNAIKFTPEGGELGLVVEPDEAHEQVRLIVWDKGIGIKPENLPRLFQPFTQIDSNLAREYSGTGLGLSLVKSLVELHQGSVEVESVFGEGSRFTVTLPWVAQISPSPSPRSENTPQDQSGSNPRKAHSLGTVLIADDNQILLTMLTDFLEGKNFNTASVRSGIELLEKIEEI
ncbi:MAG TPA: PAS domain S-box protein, partial [Anaerolineales bacterium]|nr:PAS domain S-box protein [Anaerolineales bacterium]